MTDFRVTLDDIELEDAIKELKAKNAADAVKIALESYFVAVDVEQE